RPGPKPTLLGVAHACQQVDTLPIEPWDIPLNAVVSDQHIVRPVSISKAT
ncbi:MAG: 5-formyltetrahydrofolate cyclo-ligase, partial [Halomonas sp.]